MSDESKKSLDQINAALKKSGTCIVATIVQEQQNESDAPLKKVDVVTSATLKNRYLPPLPFMISLPLPKKGKGSE